MAILLGAFYIQGLQPGPEMLRGNISLIFLMAWTVAVANIIAAGVCLLFANRMAKVATLPGAIIVPMVLLLAAIGAYTTHTALEDIVLAVIFGVVGYAMKKFDWPRPVLVIGLVLARTAEKNLLLSLRLFQFQEIFTRPLTLILIAIFIATLVMTIRSRQAKEAKTKLVPAGTGGASA